MAKRKRATYGDDNGERAEKLRKKEVPEKIIQSKKLLNRALKTAKGFERQKLGKRLKNATDAGKIEDVERINREIEVLKRMELGLVVEGHLWKSLGKVKALAENEELLEAKSSLKIAEELPDLGEDDKKAWGNITSGMFNMKPVKDAMAQIIADMYETLGIPPPVSTKGNSGLDPEAQKKATKSILKSGPSSTTKNGESLEKDGSDWEGIKSGDEEVPIPDNSMGSESGSDDIEGDLGLEDDDIDDEVLNKYQELIGGSSDEESFDEDLYKAHRNSSPSARLPFAPSISLSPSPSLSASSSDSESDFHATTKAKKSNRVIQETPKTSTFLPTLMGGYWSGSESSASDIEDDPKSSLPIRKNRPGQMARRAIWEKKFKNKANHITQGQGTVEEVRNSKKKDDRGAHRGRNGGKGRGGSARGGGDYGATREKRREFTSGDNAMPLGHKKRAGKKDDVGILHPSWQAAKKAKTEQKTATFAGKKMVFD